MELNACVGIIMVIRVLELLICGMCSNPNVNEQCEVRDLAVSLDCVVFLCSAREDLSWIVAVLV